MLMFTLGSTFSLFSILSAKTDANFPITLAKIQILGAEIVLSWHIGTNLLCKAASKEIIWSNIELHAGLSKRGKIYSICEMISLGLFV